MYYIIGVWGSKRRVYAATKFLLYTMFGSAFLLVGILYLYVESGNQLGRSTFDLTALEPACSCRRAWGGGCSSRSSSGSR